MGSILGSAITASASHINTAVQNLYQQKFNRETNEANLQAVHETNQYNYDIAREANDWNYRMFQEENAWNEMMWNKNNQYNSPQEQMNRLIRAGINPLYAAGNIGSGEAQQLTSAHAAPAETATMIAPHYEEPRFVSDDLVGIANSVINGMQGFQRLRIEQQEADTRGRQTDSNISLQKSQASYYDSLAEGLNLQNTFNKETFPLRSKELQANIDKLTKEVSLMDKQGAEYDAKVKLLDSQVNLNKALVTKSEAETRAIFKNIAFRAQELQLQQNAQNINLGRLQVDFQKYNLEVDKFKSDLASKSNEELLRLMESRKGLIGKYFPQLNASIDYVFGNDETYTYDSKLQENMQQLEAIGFLLSERYLQSPSESNYSAYMKFYNFANSLNISLPSPSTVETSPNGFGIMNP